MGEASRCRLIRAFRHSDGDCERLAPSQRFRALLDLQKELLLHDELPWIEQEHHEEGCGYGGVRGFEHENRIQAGGVSASVIGPGACETAVREIRGPGHNGKCINFEIMHKCCKIKQISSMRRMRCISY